MDRDEQIRLWQDALGGGGVKRVQFNELLRNLAIRYLRKRYAHADHVGDIHTLIDASVNEALHEFWNRYDPTRKASQSPLTFVIDRAIYRLHSRLKKEKRHYEKHVALRESDLNRLIGTDNPVDAAISAELKMKLIECLPRLPSELWRVLQSIYIEMVSRRMIAKRLGISRDWVSEKEKEACEWLRRCIESKTQPGRGGGA